MIKFYWLQQHNENLSFSFSFLLRKPVMLANLLAINNHVLQSLLTSLAVFRLEWYRTYNNWLFILVSGFYSVVSFIVLLLFYSCIVQSIKFVISWCTRKYFQDMRSDTDGFHHMVYVFILCQQICKREKNALPHLCFSNPKKMIAVRYTPLANMCIK